MKTMTPHAKVAGKTGHFSQTNNGKAGSKTPAKPRTGAPLTTTRAGS